MGCDVSRITDSDVLFLASIGQSLRGDYTNVEQDALWRDSPFDWIRRLAPRRKGKVAEQLVAGWCAAKGLAVGESGDTDADRVINGRRVEVKMSTLWDNGAYTFQQLRDQEYQHVVCLGLSPFDASCWAFPKAVIWERAIPQHGGSSGTDTRWISFGADSPPEWMCAYGGRLAKAYEVIESW